MGNYLSTAIRGNRGGNLALGLARPRKRGTPSLAHQASLAARGRSAVRTKNLVQPPIFVSTLIENTALTSHENRLAVPIFRQTHLHHGLLAERGVGKQQGGTIVYSGKDVLFGAAGCILWSCPGQNGNPGKRDRLTLVLWFAWRRDFPFLDFSGDKT